MSDSAAALVRLLEVMRTLRDPAEGCPWDRVQTFATIAPHTIEEAHEVADAIARDDLVALRDELGDLLFQVVYHAQLAEEIGAFDFAAVAQGINEKLVRRHPHVFGAERSATNRERRQDWELLKTAEQAAEAGPLKSVLEDVPATLPALARAHRIGRKVARVGFDWPGPAGAFDKVIEEVQELRDAQAQVASKDRLFEEFGDLLFALCNVARKLDLDPEAALRHANVKFERRFRAVEAKLAARGKRPRESDLAEMDALWDEVKREESGRGGLNSGYE